MVRDIFSISRFSFCVFMEDLEQGKDTEVQGLANVGRMSHEFDKNDSLGTSIGDNARRNMSGMRVDQKDNRSIVEL
jgi:hypothetical protein